MDSFKTTWTLAAGILVVATTGPVRAETTKIDFYPPGINLEAASDRQSFVVVATRGDGVTEDVTSKATIDLPEANLVRRDGRTVYPVADGKGTISVAYDGQKASVPVAVTNFANSPPVSFRQDVMPVFMRAGCNTGSCHGAARGKDGFHLSLFGYDPAGDHFRLTREIPFRRINLALPEESLLLEKPTGAVPHGGGTRFDADSEYYQTLLKWLQAGSPDDGAAAASVEDVEVFPTQAVLEGAGTQQPLVVRAKYSDGTDRDVTKLAVFLSNNDASAPVDADGLVTAADRGEAFVLARFDTKTVGSQMIVLPAKLEYTPPGEPAANYIDELVNAKLQKLRILPSGVCSDRVFLRRATIDTVGRLPSEAEYHAFLADKSPDKRAKLVAELVNRKEFAEIWAMKWAELLMIRSSNQVSYKSAYLYASWLTDRISKNEPLDQMVRELLGSTGGTFGNPATNFYQIETDTLKTSENVAQAFMGLRIQCAQCHNHPFDRWTMDDYYSFAAFFSQIGRKTGEDYRETIVYDRGSGSVKHPVGNRTMEPKFLGGPTPDVAGKDRREVLAEWLTSPENPYFAPSVANRIWAHYMGIGIVDPVDDMRVSNPPSNPELLKTLGNKLVEYNYDFKRLVCDICASNAYQRAAETNASNESDQRNFAHATIRRIQAEMLLDCISEVTETKDKFKGLPLGARAVQIADGTTSNYFLTTFGRASRETVDAHEVKTSPTLSQALHLLNGETTQDKVRSGGVVKRMLEAKRTPEEVIRSLYIRSLSREPEADELKRLSEMVAAQENTEETLNDIFWALLNSREFCFNH